MAGLPSTEIITCQQLLQDVNFNILDLLGNAEGLAEVLAEAREKNVSVDVLSQAICVAEERQQQHGDKGGLKLVQLPEGREGYVGYCTIGGTAEKQICGVAVMANSHVQDETQASNADTHAFWAPHGRPNSGPNINYTLTPERPAPGFIAYTGLEVDKVLLRQCPELVFYIGDMSTGSSDSTNMMAAAKKDKKLQGFSEFKLQALASAGIVVMVVISIGCYDDATGVLDKLCQADNVTKVVKVADGALRIRWESSVNLQMPAEMAQKVVERLEEKGVDASLVKQFRDRQQRLASTPMLLVGAYHFCAGNELSKHLVVKAIHEVFGCNPPQGLWGTLERLMRMRLLEADVAQRSPPNDPQVQRLIDAFKSQAEAAVQEAEQQPADSWYQRIVLPSHRQQMCVPPQLVPGAAEGESGGAEDEGGADVQAEAADFCMFVGAETRQIFPVRICYYSRTGTYFYTTGLNHVLAGVGSDTKLQMYSSKSGMVVFRFEQLSHGVAQVAASSSREPSSMLGKPVAGGLLEAAALHADDLDAAAAKDGVERW